MVEQEAVNFEVTGSSPVAGAKLITLKDLRIEGLFACVFDLIIYLTYTLNIHVG